MSSKESTTNNKIVPEHPVACDIGGSFAKFVYFRPPDPPELPAYVLKEHDTLADKLPLKADDTLAVSCSELGGTLRFLKFPSSKVVDFSKFILSSKLHNQYGKELTSINATGGGAYKFSKVVKEQLGIEFRPCDEMLSIIRGLNFLLKYSKEEVFTYHPQTHKQQFISMTELKFPYLLVSVGSGVSILRVDGEEKFERVSGSSIGGGTFWGLCKLITGVSSYEELMELSSAKGHDNSAIDLFVGDIYGGDYQELGLPADLIASSFAKCGLEPSPFEGSRVDAQTSSGRKPTKKDFIQSMLFMIATNIAQIAYLNAQRFGVENIFFTGGWIHGNPAVWDRISFGLEFW
eukprot:CAMPEP_0201550216 /NCGR_PEP_ID=MMETSP0173_2-20130828/6610_1 /ASSEMBLY_ACC=CAM_ASM_000268 /TAXON_ID=218659 /ORGANISM="Vexillifera sp., Strain DIVA3 564/2" /LENGTH=346 /DNA_ID=CAMNT_0047960129 /DNA_START=1364 /DNA_END=2401 /DNA_ORIENTATION=-